MSTTLFAQLQASLGTAYRLERELGGGGMSRVFLAHDTVLERKIVVKVLLPELAASVSVDRFRREIQLAAQLQHPHIVPLLSAGQSEGIPYFTMPFIAGESLRVKLAREGELPVTETVRILRDVVSALVYAHGAGVVHRDIKPDNVLLSGGVAVVTDFGVAKAVSVSAEVAVTTSLTSAGMALGTPAYMAPEQAAGDAQADHRADLYALGAMAYEMLAGQPPFAGRSPQAVLAAHVIETPEPVDRRRPAIPPTLATLVMTCLAKRPADRPQSAANVLHVLDAIGTPTSGTASTTVTAVRGGGRAGPRRRSRSIAVVTAGALVAAGGMLWWWGTPRPAVPPLPPEPPKAVGAVRDSVATAEDGLEEKPVPPRESVVAERRKAQQAPTTRPAPSAAPEPTSQPEAVRPLPTPAVKPFVQSDSVSRRPPPATDSAPPQAPPPSPSESLVPAPLPPPPPVVAPAPRPTPTPIAPARPPEPDPRPEIRRLVAEYANAVESRNVENLRRLYPGLTPVQQRGWEQFFDLVRDVKAQLSVAQLDVSGATADARIIGNYTYLNSSTRRTEQQPVSFRAALRRDASGWRIAQVR